MILREKISELYDVFGRELLTYIFGFVRSREIAEDILHDSFVRLIQKSTDYMIEDINLRAYLYKISRNMCIDHLRKYRKLCIVQTDKEIRDTNTAHENMRADELHEKIHSLLENLHESSRSVFYMKKELHLTFREIAENLGISERTAKRKLNTVLRYLYSELKRTGYIGSVLIFLALY